MGTDAQRFAKARREYLAARAKGCTIPELRHQLNLERLDARAQARAEARQQCGTGISFFDFSAPWMMRD